MSMHQWPPTLQAAPGKTPELNFGSMSRSLPPHQAAAAARSDLCSSWFVTWAVVGHAADACVRPCCGERVREYAPIATMKHSPSDTPCRDARIKTPCEIPTEQPDRNEPTAMIISAFA